MQTLEVPEKKPLLLEAQARREQLLCFLKLGVLPSVVKVDASNRPGVSTMLRRSSSKMY